MSLEQKELDTILENVKEAGKAQFKVSMEEAKEGLITPGQFAEGIKELASKEDVTKATESIEKLVADMKALEASKKTIDETVFDLIKENKSGFEAIHAGKDSDMKLVVNPLMIKTTVTTPGAWTDNTQAIRIPGVNEPASRRTKIADLFSQFSIPSDSGGAIRYVDQTTTTRSAAARTEGVAAAESAIAFTEYDLSIRNISDSIPASRESLLNFNYLEGLLRKFIITNCDLAEEAQVYSGTGTSPQLKGVSVSGTTFLPASMISDTVQAASVYDLITYIAAYIASGKDSKYMADYVLMNDMDVWAMLSVKDANDNYLMPPFVRIVGERIFVGPVEVIPSSLVTTNTMVLGDFRQGEYHNDPNWEITFGWVNTDFTKNLVRMLANKRAALLVKTLDITAFYKVTDIDAAVALLTS